MSRFFAYHGPVAWIEGWLMEEAYVTQKAQPRAWHLVACSL